MRDWLKTYGIKVLTAIALLALPLIYFLYSNVSWKPLNPHDHLIQNALAYLLFLLFSYFNHTLFVPRWFLNKRYVRYATVSVCCILVLTYLPYRAEQWAFFKRPQVNTFRAWTRQIFVEEMMFGPPSFSGPFSKQGADNLDPFEPGNTLNRGTKAGRSMNAPVFYPKLPLLPVLSTKLAIFFLLGSVSTLLSASVLMARRLGQVENDKLKAELQQLKAQIHPHFLFNTLNCIYSLSIRNDERTPETIVKLSEFMRYIISDAHRDKVPLLTEVSYIANYIDLQKARLQDSVQVDYLLEGDGQRFQIAPLILFSFIENAFKYGVDPDVDSLIVIHLKIHDQGLTLYVANSKAQISHFEKSTGIGLQNTKERLRLLYPAEHKLSIEDTFGHFRINLSLTL